SCPGMFATATIFCGYRQISTTKAGPCADPALPIYGWVLARGLDRLADLVHVQRAGLLDEGLEALRRDATGLLVEDDAVADDHQGRDRLNAESRLKILVGVDVDLAEHDVLVPRGHLFEDRREAVARPAPIGPEVDERDAIAGLLVERGRGEFLGGHF